MQRPWMHRLLRLSRDGRRFAIGMVCGVLLAVAGTTLAQDEPLDRSKVEAYVMALENVIVSLAVDTERSAIGVAELNGRMRQVERRLAALEGRPPETGDGEP